jgi:hypothetical protein
MIDTIKKIMQRQQLKKDLLAFLAETEKNLELFYVIDQRQFTTQGFALQSWEAVKNEEVIKKHEAIAVYIRELAEFNRLFKEHKEYEQWYVSDITNKTPENARKLHGMKHDLDQKLKGLEAVIILAGQALELEMVQLGFLKYE